MSLTLTRLTGVAPPFVLASALPEPTLPGLEFTLPINRLRFTLPKNRMHFTLPQNTMRFTLPEEDK